MLLSTHTRLWAVAVALFVVMDAPAVAQVRCTMPNGVVITQQLGDCPRDAVAAQRLDGTPLPLKPVQSRAGGVQGGDVRLSPATATRQVLPADSDGGMSLWSWLIVGLLGYGLFQAVRGSVGKSGPVQYCTTCGHEGRGRTHTRGSLLIEIVLWLCFLVPGLIYSIWRQGSKHKVCGSCGAATLVPLHSPVARAARRNEVDAASGLPATDDRDAWEGSFYDAPAQRSANKTVRIVYRDADGALTERVVEVRAFEPQGASGMVFGRCRLRNGMRTFRFDRMVRVVDEDTGEIVPNLQALLNEEWQASPEPVLDALFSQHGDLLKMLLYAAKADGAMRAAELQVIARHCIELTGDARITSDMVRQLLDVLGMPSITSFTRIYNKLRRERPADAARAAQACREIVGTQKTIHPGEQALLAALDKPLPKLAASGA